MLFNKSLISPPCPSPIPYHSSSFAFPQSTFESSKFCTYHKRLQTFLLFFVEGASFIEDDDIKWEIYTL